MMNIFSIDFVDKYIEINMIELLFHDLVLFVNSLALKETEFDYASNYELIMITSLRSTHELNKKRYLSRIYQI